MTVDSGQEQNRRKEKRFYPESPINVTLYLLPQKTSIRARLINLSKSGLCVGIDAPLPDDTQVVLKLAGQGIALRTMWSLMPSSSQNGIRCGFACADPAVDLIEALRKVGRKLGKTEERFQREDEVFADQL